jgi:hypothetical protein
VLYIIIYNEMEYLKLTFNASHAKTINAYKHRIGCQTASHRIGNWTIDHNIGQWTATGQDNGLSVTG